LAAQVVGLDRADAEVGAYGGDPVAVGQAGAGGPAVGELGLLVCEREIFALVLLGLDAADLVRRGLVVDEQHDQAADGLQAVAGELVAGAGGQQSPLAGVEDDVLAGGPVADAGDELAHGHQHAREPLDPLGGELAARVGCEFDVLQRDAHERARGDGCGRGGDVEQCGRRRVGRLGMGHGGSFRGRVE
jgi:hypothetical protein